ncbi:MAG: hypothetical protein UHW86_02495 [Spirochaetota bacterium]|nr:hypothetical protein [Spirochaetota bacterium]
MKETHGTQTVEAIAGRKIILSAGNGKTNINDLKWLTATVLEAAAAWKTSGWAYIADCTKMEPVSPDEVGQLIEMTKAFVEAGCKAFGFAEGSSVMLKAQTKTNTKFSHTGVIEGHFATVEEVLSWLQKDIHI